jgi:hypothetical protein
MINEGFKSTVSKEDVKEVNGRLDHIEKQILADYRRRIESLEQDLTHEEAHRQVSIIADYLNFVWKHKAEKASKVK